MTRFVIKAAQYYCEAIDFQIDGQSARYEDFGNLADRRPQAAPDYGCGNMQFRPDNSLKKSAMSKYNLTLAEYEYICDTLEDELSFGMCGYCA